MNQDPKYDTGLVCGGTLEVFVEPVLPPALLYVFGAGHVAFNLCQVAAERWFRSDRDRRSHVVTRPRNDFPAAREVHALDFDEAMKKLDPERVFLHRDRHARASRRHAHSALGGADAGPLRRHDRIEAQGDRDFQDAAEVRVWLRILFDRVHAPVGLDIGAITPEEIAVAITAELIAIRRQSAAASPHMSWFHSQESQA